MKCTCHKADLLKAFSLTQKAIGGIETLPILENILISAEGQHLVLTANNLEIAITTSCPAQVQNEGKVTIPAKTATSWIHLAPDDQIELSSNEAQEVAVKSGSSRTVFKGLSADDFPSLPQIDKQLEVTIPAQQLRQALDRTTFAAAAVGTRPILSGIYCAINGNEVTLVGTDSYRLSEQRITLEDAASEAHTAVIPARTLQELERILGTLEDSKTPITIVLAENQVEFRIGSTRMISRLIDGQFPNYQQILPKSESYTAAIPRQAFIQSLKRILLFARLKQNTIELSFSPTQLALKSNATDIGSEESTLEIQGSGEGFTLSLNAQYLLDALLALSGDSVRVLLAERFSPVSILSDQAEGFLHIIMPLKGN